MKPYTAKELTIQIRASLKSVAGTKYELLIDPIKVLDISPSCVTLRHNTESLAAWVDESYGDIVSRIVAPREYQWDILPPPPDEDEKDIRIRQLEDLTVKLYTSYESDRKALAEGLISPIEQMHNSLLQFLRTDLTKRVVEPIPITPKLIIELVEKYTGVKIDDMVGRRSRKETVATANNLYARKVLVYLIKKYAFLSFEQIGKILSVSKQVAIKHYHEVAKSTWKFARILKPLETLIRNLSKGDYENDF